MDATEHPESPADVATNRYLPSTLANVRTSFAKGVDLDPHFGVVISPDSSIWNEEADSIVGTLKDARRAWPYFEDEVRAYMFMRAGGDEWDVDRRLARTYAYELERQPDARRAIENMSLNPFASDWVKQRCEHFLSCIAAACYATKSRRVATKSTRVNIITRDKYRCRYCGEPVSRGSARIDHVIPYSLGGLTEDSNLATACYRCNAAKAGMTLEQSRMTLLPIPAD